MMKNANKVIPILIEFWQRYCALSDTHLDWLTTFAQVMAVKRNARLYDPDDEGRQKDYLYFVCNGLLATLWWDEQGNRRIDRFLLPHDSVLTRHTLYTEKPADYHVVALRKSIVIRIPAEAFKAYRESCREADVLSDVLEYKKLKQFRAKDRLLLIKDQVPRYIRFYDDMAGIREQTSQREQYEYLCISKMSVTRALELIRKRR